MGQEQNQDDIVYGNDCTYIFDEGKTPKHVYARFSKVFTCPNAPATAPNDRVFKLTQNPYQPCWWEYDDGTWFVGFYYYPYEGGTALVLQYIATYDRYFDGVEPDYTDEGHVFTNFLDECIGNKMGILGIAVVTWRLESINLLSLLNIKTSDKLFMEMRPKDDGSKIYKYCKLKDGTNIAIEYKPD